MSNWLSALVDRANGAAPVLQPRPRSAFEPAAALTSGRIDSLLEGPRGIAVTDGTDDAESLASAAPRTRETIGAGRESSAEDHPGRLPDPASGLSISRSKNGLANQSRKDLDNTDDRERTPGPLLGSRSRTTVNTDAAATELRQTDSTRRHGGLGEVGTVARQEATDAAAVVRQTSVILNQEPVGPADDNHRHIADSEAMRRLPANEAGDDLPATRAADHDRTADERASHSESARFRHDYRDRDQAALADEGISDDLARTLASLKLEIRSHSSRQQTRAHDQSYQERTADPATNSIRITIGRIEVHPVPRPVERPRRPAASDSSLARVGSLEEYLQQRRRGRLP